jgi:hypothetical protein
MKSDYLRKNIGRILLAFSFIAGIGLVSTGAVHAQGRDRDGDYRRDGRRDRNRDSNRRAESRRTDQYDRSRVYNDRSRVYNNGGYNNGVYNNGRYGNGSYGGYGGYGNVNNAAQNQGYQDGLYTGSSDAQRGQNYNPQRSHFYRNGHSDNGNYGYGGYQSQQAYRNGFLSGYDAGFRRYGGGYNNRRSNGNYGIRFPW